MKIRQKLTLSFSVTVTVILVLFGFTIYYFSSQYRKNEFYNRLTQRVEITEKMFLEKDNFSDEMYQKIQEQFLNRLPEETEEVYEIKDSAGKKQLTKLTKYPVEFTEDLLETEEAYFENDSIQGVGKIFHLEQGEYAVILTAIDQMGIRKMTYLRTIIVLTLAGCILIVALASYYFSGQVLNPISKKIQKANAISARNIHERLIVYNPDDELGALAVAFNNLLDRVTGAFEAQRSFIDNASHEMRNPLTAIIGEAEVALEKERTREEYTESLHAIATEADRLNSLLNNLLQLATISYREVAFKSELIDGYDLLLESKKKFDFLCPENKVRLQFTRDPAHYPGPLIKGNNHLLQTAFINIFDNASKFSFYEEVDVMVYSKSRGTITVSVRDKGVGIPAEDIPKVFQPFHRAHNVRRIKGTGIGIPLSHKILELHKGWMEIESKLNKGTEVKITLPIFN